jgi:glycosyltransferase involved in cell wall biosynthesis
MDEKLKILYISHYFPPEVNAPAVRVSEMSRRWAENGADVTVLTTFPNHPTGIIPEQYKGHWHRRESLGPVKVIRTFVYAAPNKGFLRRIMNYLSFMLSAIIIGTGQVERPNLLIATSPQFFVAVAGYIISRLKRCKFVFEVRDLWPEEIVAVGAIENRFIIRLLESLEMFLYRKADLIVAVAQGTIDTLQRRGVPISKMALAPNGVDIEFFRTRANGRNVRERLAIDDKFIVGYIGTHGMAHKLETVIQAAYKLREVEDIHFLFVGDGAEKSRLVSLARQMELENVLFHEQISRELIPEYYAACDTCLVPLRKADLFTRNIPSKIYEVMASGRPIIISTEGESKRLVELSGAGLCAAPEDSIDLAQKILSLKKDKNLREKMGRSGYSFVMANSSRQRLADEYLSIIRGVVAGISPEPSTKMNEAKAEDNCSESDKERVSV